MNQILEALIHHVELNNAGWRNKTISLMILNVLYEASNAVSPAEIASELKKKFGTILDNRAAERMLKNLEKDGKLIRKSKGTFELSEEGRSEINKHDEEARDLELRVKQRFEGIVALCCPTAKISWGELKSEILIPLTNTLGARVYDLLRGDGIKGEISNRLPSIDAGWSLALRKQVVSAVEKFIDPNDSDVRAYILRTLNTNLLIRATSVSEKELEALQASSSNRLTMKIFVDTNLLFSLMGLHENPADNSAEALVKMSRELGDRVNIEYVVLPHTIDEARRTLGSYAERLARVHFTPNILSAIGNHTTELSGISLKYFLEAVKAKGEFSAKEYFKPYLENFVTVMRSFGVELHNANITSMRTDQEVIDDIIKQQEWEKTKRPEKAKTYEALEHDFIMWHFVNRLRSPSVDSPLHAHYWIGTIDYRFISFDEYKRKKEHRKVQLCIHPTTMLQMLQFWIPRTTTFEKTMVMSLWPLLPHVFNRSAEETILKILSVISRYKDASDLPEETISNVLMNDSLKARMKLASSDIEENELIEGELIRENENLHQLWNEEKEKSAQLNSKIQEREIEAKHKETQYEDIIAKFHQKVEVLEGELSQSKSERERAERTLAEKREQNEKFVVLRDVALKCTSIAVAEIALVWFAVSRIDWITQKSPIAPWLVIAFLFLSSIWIFLECGCFIIAREALLKGHKAGKWIIRFRNYARGSVSLVVVLIIAEIIRMGFKERTP